MLKFMLICNDPAAAELAVASGANRIFVDLEQRGKLARQGGRNTVISDHSLDDVAAIRERMPQTEILVRVNPIYDNTPFEVEGAISVGASVVMLPMIRSREEVEQFIECVDGRAKVCLLIETAQALTRLPEILKMSADLDEIYFGLNDMHISLGLDFMFECLAGGLIEHGVRQSQAAGLRTGFGGIGRIGSGAVPAERILGEHVRLDSSIVILSREFSQDTRDSCMAEEIARLRAEEQRLRALSADALKANRDVLQDEIWAVAQKMRSA